MRGRFNRRPAGFLSREGRSIYARVKKEATRTPFGNCALRKLPRIHCAGVSPCPAPKPSLPPRALFRPQAAICYPPLARCRTPRTPQPNSRWCSTENPPYLKVAVEHLRELDRVDDRYARWQLDARRRELLVRVGMVAGGEIVTMKDRWTCCDPDPSDRVGPSTQS